jgi:5-formyltetrahydrofolate cyclo-ligase
MKKQELRKIYRHKRKELSGFERAKLDDLLLIKFQQAEIPFIKSLFSYWPIEENQELNTHILTDFLEFKNPGLVVAYPRTDTMMDEMIAVVVNAETDFLKNDFNIYEPAAGDVLPADEIDMVLVPLLAFDKKGYRVGYGKGYYDKFLAECKKDCLKVGLSYFDPIETITDKADFDVPLNFCITPQTIYVF